MPIFALRKIEAIKGKQEFDKLVVDGKCPFDEFENSLEVQYKAELAGIYNYMQNVADLKAVPEDKASTLGFMALLNLMERLL